MLSHQGYTKEQEKALYDAQLQDIIDNPRWYLDNLTFMREYKVFWKDYSNRIPTVPYEYVKQEGL